ncbi:MAG TPA: sulfatase-like hydrolase/transferase, partial [Acidobacteriaceae bacterium]|nr:sulfatase-like hydrolase/transferase [Acidobacteriaceae bacterium]
VLPTLTRKAVELVEQHKTGAPLFLYFAMPSPHTPWVPLPEDTGRSRAGTYGDYVAEVDDMLGQVMQALERAGMAENTLLIFTSDNGADWKPEDLARFEHRANADWRGEKADIWEAGHRIPFVARWPGHIPVGSVSNDLGCLSDFMATVAAIDGIPLPRNAAEDSMNLLPTLLGQSRVPLRDALVDHSYEGMLCIREGNWKLEEGLGSGGFSFPKKVEPAPGGPRGQLYDIAADPQELHNLYQQRPEIVERLTRLLEKYQQQGYSRPM